MNATNRTSRVDFVSVGEHAISDKLTEEHRSEKPHSFYADRREGMIVRGVLDVLSFDDSEVLLVTTSGHLSLEGTSLHVTVLNTKDGIVEITGKLYGLLYDDDDPALNGSKHKGKRGFFGRLLS